MPAMWTLRRQQCEENRGQTRILLQPHDAAILEGLGTAYLQHGQSALAMQTFKEVMAMDAMGPDRHAHQLGRAYLRANRFGEAVKTLKIWGRSRIILSRYLPRCLSAGRSRCLTFHPCDGRALAYRSCAPRGNWDQYVVWCAAPAGVAPALPGALACGVPPGGRRHCETAAIAATGMGWMRNINLTPILPAIDILGFCSYNGHCILRK